MLLMNFFHLQINCYDNEKITLILTSLQLEYMEKIEYRIIKRWANLMKYTYKNSEVDTNGF